MALRQMTFTVNDTDRVAVAHLFAGDSDADGINDGFEQFYYGTLANGADRTRMATEYLSWPNTQREQPPLWQQSPGRRGSGPTRAWSW